jgi:hypothetical protein
MSEAARAKLWTGVGFWLRWVAATAIGVMVAFAVFVALFSVIGEPGDLLFPVLMAGVGVVVGAFQQRVLRRVLQDANGWAIATGIGLGVGMALALALGEGSGLGGKILTGVVHGGAIGALLGTLQWRVLTGRVPGSRWWVPASIGGWAVGGAAADAVGYFVEGLDIVAGPVVAAAVTGIALVALLRRFVLPAAFPRRPPGSAVASTPARASSRSD